MKENIINLDLHGGDFAPNSVLEGARIAKLKHLDIKFQLHATNECYQEYKKNILMFLIHLYGLKQIALYPLK